MILSFHRLMLPNQYFSSTHQSFMRSFIDHSFNSLLFTVYYLLFTVYSLQFTAVNTLASFHDSISSNLLIFIFSPLLTRTGTGTATTNYPTTNYFIPLFFQTSSFLCGRLLITVFTLYFSLFYCLLFTFHRFYSAFLPIPKYMNPASFNSFGS